MDGSVFGDAIVGSVFGDAVDGSVFGDAIVEEVGTGAIVGGVGDPSMHLQGSNIKEVRPRHCCVDKYPSSPRSW